MARSRRRARDPRIRLKRSSCPITHVGANVEDHLKPERSEGVEDPILSVGGPVRVIVLIGVLDHTGSLVQVPHDLRVTMSDEKLEDLSLV